MINYTLSLAAVLALSLNLNAQMWQQMNDIPFSGRHHGIGFSLNGEGYILTGSQERNYWKYDPLTDVWQNMGDYPGFPRGYGIGDTHNGKAYFGFGIVTVSPGVNVKANDLWEYDPVTDTFTQLASCPCTERTHPAFVALNDKIFMGMGHDTGNLNDWWEYDIPTDTWTQKPDLPGANRHHPYMFAVGNQVYVGSGHHDDWYQYDPVSEIWTQIADLPSYTKVAGAQFNYGGKGYVLSGVGHLNGGTHNAMPTGEFWEYDPFLDTWTALPPHPGQSVWAPGSFILDDYVYMVSGDDNTNQSVYRYNLAGISTAVQESQHTELSVYPNPSSDFLRINGIALTEAIRVSVVSANGKEVELDFDLDGTVAIRGLSNSVYLLKVQTKDTVLSTRFLKE